MSRLGHIRNWAKLGRAAEYSVTRLAALVGVHRSSLGRFFLKRFRQTPEQFLTSLRLEDSSRHVLSGLTLIKHASDAAGYKHPSSFTRAFKRSFGLAPSKAGLPPFCSAAELFTENAP